MHSAKHIIQRFVDELWNARRLDVADQIFSDDCITHQLRSGFPVEPAHRGPQEMKEHISGWLASFPDLRFTIEQMIAQSDHVVTQLLMEGTHQGTWMGIPPTGKQLQIRMITTHRIANGKIAEDWVLVESLGLFQQLGAVPDTPELIRNFVRHSGAGSN
ncbi:MAG TPA: ester cyclase [Candidatus Sulfotelmatobacter sp.]|nr:ester cyclase [Candidatus Sulfotelmatobacter sp.]